MSSLSIEKRGIVIAPPFHSEGSGLVFELTVPDPAALRQYVLYWDQLDWPDNNLISMGASEEIEFLAKAGVLTRTRINVGGTGSLTDGYVLAQLTAYKAHEQAEPGIWAFAQSTDMMFIPLNDATQAAVLELALIDSLPVPSPGTSLGDILQFKERRRPELLRFRASLDELGEAVTIAENKHEACQAAIQNIRAAVSSIGVVMNESIGQRIVRKMKIELGGQNLMSAIAAWKVAEGTGWQIPAAITAALATTIKLDVREIAAPRVLPSNLAPFAYVHSVATELGTSRT